MRNAALCCLGLSGTFLIAGCASIVDGEQQSLFVETRHQDAAVSGAQCRLRNDKGTWFVTTPGSVTVHRSYQDMVVECSKAGLPTGWASIKSTTKGMAFGNILFGGVIGAGVDIGNGAAYDYPQVIVVDMGKTKSITSEPAKTPAPNPTGNEGDPVAGH